MEIKQIKPGDLVVYAPLGPKGTVVETAVGRVQRVTKYNGAFIWFGPCERPQRVPLNFVYPIINNIDEIYKGEEE